MKERKNFYVEFEGAYLDNEGYYSEERVLMTEDEAFKVREDYRDNGCGEAALYYCPLE